jgi:hypothetical protein
MWRWFVRVFAALLVVGACALPAQAAVGLYDRQEEAEEGGRTPAMQYGLAVLFSLVTLIIVCMPSRKGSE